MSFILDKTAGSGNSTVNVRPDSINESGVSVVKNLVIKHNGITKAVVRCIQKRAPVVILNLEIYPNNNYSINPIGETVELRYWVTIDDVRDDNATFSSQIPYGVNIISSNNVGYDEQGNKYFYDVLEFPPNEGSQVLYWDLEKGYTLLLHGESFVFEKSLRLRQDLRTGLEVDLGGYTFIPAYGMPSTIPVYYDENNQLTTGQPLKVRYRMWEGGVVNLDPENYVKEDVYLEGYEEYVGPIQSTIYIEDGWRVLSINLPPEDSSLLTALAVYRRLKLVVDYNHLDTTYIASAVGIICKAKASLWISNQETYDSRYLLKPIGDEDNPGDFIPNTGGTYYIGSLLGIRPTEVLGNYTYDLSDSNLPSNIWFNKETYALNQVDVDEAYTTSGKMYLAETYYLGKFTVDPNTTGSQRTLKITINEPGGGQLEMEYVQEA